MIDSPRMTQANADREILWRTRSIVPPFGSTASEIMLLGYQLSLIRCRAADDDSTTGRSIGCILHISLSYQKRLLSAVGFFSRMCAHRRARQTRCDARGNRRLLDLVNRTWPAHTIVTPRLFPSVATRCRSFDRNDDCREQRNPDQSKPAAERLRHWPSLARRRDGV